MTAPRHFLTLMDLSADEIRRLIRRAIELKALRDRGESHATLEGKVLAMIFTKASTRTRVSFEAGMSQLGEARCFSRARTHNSAAVNRSQTPQKSFLQWSTSS